MIGQTLGHYTILDLLGAGGMGEVYRAEDTRLDREVAIKVLPQEFIEDPERLARFEHEAKLLMEPDATRGEWDLCWPQCLPGGRAVLYTGWRGWVPDSAQIGVFEPATGARKVLIESGSYARYLPTGHLIFGRRGGIYLAPFDLEGLEVTGPAVPVPEPIFHEFENGVPHFSFSEGGTLAFVPGRGAPNHRLVSVDLAGNETELLGNEAGFAYPKFSPDGQRLALTISGTDGTHVWIANLATGALSRLTSQGENLFPLWTPDGRPLAYGQGRFAEATFVHPNFDLAPDGMSFVMIKPDESWGRTTELRVVLNWFEEVERLAPPSGD